MAISKKERQLVFNKFGGHCAYCGCELVNGWCVDHIESVGRTFRYKRDDKGNLMLGDDRKPIEEKHMIRPENDCIDNMNPACKRCNIWKSSMNVESFRREIQMQPERLLRDSNQYRMAKDYGLINTIDNPVVFYFEKFSPSSKQNR